MILDDIVENTKEILQKLKAQMPEEVLGRAASLAPFYPRDVIGALRKNGDRLNIIAEVKQSSPSKGNIRADFDPISIANDYETGGAAAISVLTEPKWFNGSLEYVSLIRRYSRLPILRKDFIIDRYQLLEALVYGADFVLLIARILSLKELKKLLTDSRLLGMNALVEIHDKSDLAKAVAASADIVGINHRNLDDMTIDLNLSEKLIPLIPQGKIIVAESGLASRSQLIELSKMGADAFLIGEFLLSQSDIVSALRKMTGTYV
ncbi:MAG: indole-3-glycerol phosphate synthase TrpC [Helicobacteraceae bacterium]|jgi:indole-3-glycerol phosphate synthase|nr:indole-3-glycerol phosphate synthase TrpC [Helicobacteraceae bacterium]